MQMTRLWHAYVAAYAFAMAIPFLLFPNAVPFIHYAPPDLVWVRLTGMCLAGYAYFNCSLIRERHLPSMRANVVNQAIGTVCVGTLALMTGSTALDVVAVVILVGFIGMALSLQMERRAFTPPRPTAAFPMTAQWNWYVAGYTFFYTIATGVFPHQILPIVGFDDPVLPWERITGMLFLVLCIFNVVVAREKGTGPIILAILTLRVWFVSVLIALGLLGYPWFVLASAVIVGIGVVGTIVTYRRERQSSQVRPATAPTR